MISFLFWNLMSNQAATWAVRSAALRTHIARIVSNFSVDVLLLAESAFNPSEVIGALNGDGGPAIFCYPPSNSRRIQLFTRFPEATVTDQFNDSSDGRLTIRRLTASPTTDVLLAGVHFQSQMAWDTDEQALQATVLP